MKKLLTCINAFILLTLLAACGEDRSDEVPYAPTVTTLAPAIEAGNVRFSGRVEASPNSSLTETGFFYGNDTLNLTIAADTVATNFSAQIDTLKAGTYYVCAFATNGIGRSTGDTLHFELSQDLP